MLKAILFRTSALWTLLVALPVAAQVPMKEIFITIEKKLTDYRKEFSGLAAWGDTLLLIPQKPAKHGNQLYGMRLSKIAEALTDLRNDSTTRPVTSFPVRLDGFPDIEGFDGIEAATRVGNTLYVAVETRHPFPDCHLLRARLVKQGNETVFQFDKKKLSIPKPVRFDNVGFESLAWLPSRNSLLAVFEYNGDTALATAILADTALDRYTPEHLRSPVMFRITDIAVSGEEEVVAINHYFCDYPCGNPDKCEYHNYRIEASDSLAREQMLGASPKDSSFTRLLWLKTTDRGLVPGRSFFISFKPDNWEGILPFNGGVLMIVDGLSGMPCRLSFFPLTTR